MKILIAIFVLTFACSAYSDTINLMNGYTIFGKVGETPEAMKKPNHYMVSFSNGGWLLLPKKEVKQITINNRDQFEEAAARANG